jgi:hypothetical protein
MPWWCSVKQKLARRARLRGRRRMVKEVASSAVVVVSWMWRRGGRPQPWRLRPAPTPSPPAWQAAASLDSPARQLQLWVALAAVPLVASVVDAVAPGLPVPPVYEAMGRPPMPLPAVDVERGGRCLVGPLPHWCGERRRWAPYLVGVGQGWVAPRGVQLWLCHPGVARGNMTLGEKNNAFLAEALSKLRFFGTPHNRNRALCRAPPSLVWRATQVGPIPRRCGPGVGGTKGSPAVALPPGRGAG